MTRRCAIAPMGSVRRALRAVARPPRDDGRVGEQQRGHDRPPVAAERAVEPQHDDLGRAGVAADPDLAVEAGRAAPVAGDDDDDPARVLAARVVGGVDGRVGLGLVDDDDEGEHARERHRAGVGAQPDEPLRDVGGGRARQVDDHGSLHSRPSRRIMASAPDGPQPPETYCSGCGALLRPELLDGVEDLPGQLDLLVPGEERRLTEEDVEDEALVGLGRRLGERAAVAEVHRDVADLHLGARAPWRRSGASRPRRAARG